MNISEISERIENLKREISLLPAGSITVKKIKGKDYYYHRFTQNRKRIENYVDFEHIDELRSQIERRKMLQAELKKLEKQLPPNRSKDKITFSDTFTTYVRTGNHLKSFAAPVKEYKRRECYSTLSDYVFGGHQDKVFILYGLRRTGKTTLIRQILLDMTPGQLEKTAFIQIKSSDTLSGINNDLRQLEDKGYQYIFIDEVTLMEDFIEGAALFSDIYASSGMKIVLSGTDSLGFVFTEYEQLYDRCITLHTTFIPYREFENVLGIKGIDEYIKYGGTMSMGGVNYNEESSFATYKSTHEYVDSAIARNIQHSLKYYQDGGHFRQLFELYENNELTGAINRVVEDINHRFTKEVLTKTFKSNDLAISVQNLLNDREKVTGFLMSLLDILNKEDQSVEIDEVHAYQIKEYLSLLDLIMEIDLVHLPDVNRKDKITVISQPGIRYAQADALVQSMLSDEKFSSLSVIERHGILNRILSDIKGRMMEDIILLETKIAHPDKEVFKLQFAVGEFDMVIFDPVTLTNQIFEIKYSRKIVPGQTRHLTDEKKCAEVEHRFGSVTGKYVIYRGENASVSGIQYINVEDYLKTL